MARNFKFQPDRVQRCKLPASARSGLGGDARDGKIYVYHESDISLAVNVAMATRRPLLLSGPSGCGKSSLAFNVAHTLGWRYYEYVVTSRTEARDLLYRFDSIERLNDAQNHQVKDIRAYIEPGVLWWAFDRDSAGKRGDKDLPEGVDPATDPFDSRAIEQSVVLIDEIDKAEADVPNSLLVPLGSLEFRVEYTGYKVTGRSVPLIFITNNGERELPLAFMRRCVTLQLRRPGEAELIEIARARISKRQMDDGTLKKIASYILKQAEEEEEGAGLAPGTAEYLDTVAACLELGIGPDDEDFEQLSRITLRKRQKVHGVSQ